MCFVYLFAFLCFAPLNGGKTNLVERDIRSILMGLYYFRLLQQTTIDWMASNIGNLFSHNSGSYKYMIKVQQSWFLMRTPFLARGHLTSSYDLT